MFSPKAIEAWFTLMAEAMQGTVKAQEAFKSLGDSTSSEDLHRWLARFMPSVSATAQPEAFEEWLEAWWRTMGVIPRSRYLDLLERYETLRRRHEKAEETIRNLRAMLEAKGQAKDEDVQQILDLWETTLKETLKAQTEWMRAWTATNQAASEDVSTAEDTSPNEQK
jgi:hypothetical protein